MQYVIFLYNFHDCLLFEVIDNEYTFFIIIILQYSCVVSMPPRSFICFRFTGVWCVRLGVRVWVMTVPGVPVRHSIWTLWEMTEIFWVGQQDFSRVFWNVLDITMDSPMFFNVVSVVLAILDSAIVVWLCVWRGGCRSGHDDVGVAGISGVMAGVASSASPGSQGRGYEKVVVPPACPWYQHRAVAKRESFYTLIQNSSCFMILN